MLILVHVAHPQALDFAGSGFGRLLSPRDCSRAHDTGAAGIPWAADNDCFQGLNEPKYRRMLLTLREQEAENCLFVTLPDVVGDWLATCRYADEWLPALDGFPIGFVAQDGQPIERVPWDEIAALFIGGTTEYKLSREALQLGREAKDRGLWLHMGRVNSRKRFNYARAIHCDSVDGSSFSKWRHTWLPDALTWHKDAAQQRLPV